ncbi:MAG: RuBisCO large subunit C-terminal-like domain-containing protein [Balneolaceae bacterium]|nr:RuBisCO large subunit C-terminal-like domain-containing protein [Balneolaceae bacterium]
MHTFRITYRIKTGPEEPIDQKIEKICLEQSAELPRHLLSDDLAEKVVGQPVAREQLEQNCHSVHIEWPLANIGGEITNFLNILYGNISLQPGIQITDAGWSALADQCFEGPSLGVDKIREKFNLESRAITCTALKPMGLSPGQLADFCYRFAKGGIDIIKDDHGLANQSYAPFEGRVGACVEAVQKAAEHTGRRSYYFPNITAPADTAEDRYKTAAQMGADGVLFCPHITGLEMLHRLARLNIDLPVMAHPAFSGSLTTVEGRGFTPAFYMANWRALGADFVIYPNTGGRFSFTEKDASL